MGSELRTAFSRCGFVYLSGHGADPAVVGDFIAAARRFFELPQEVKDRFPRDFATNHGYVAQGREQLDNLKLEPGEKVRSWSHVKCPSTG